MTTCIKNVKFQIIKLRTGCQHIGYFNYSENLNWAAQTFYWATCGPLDIAGLLWLYAERVSISQFLNY